jgi:sigma-B regulation protein RsbU (phosphoserine phosphatase)
MIHMRILIAEDDLTSRRMLEAMLAKWGYEVVVARDGNEAWQILQSDHAPQLVILDWMMPGMDGVEICRSLRGRSTGEAPPYLILLTTRDSKDDIVSGLRAGADDYITKPFDRGELQARVQVGERVMQLQCALAARITELQDALSHVRTLQGILPICMHCHRIREDHDSWQRIEKYIQEHSDVEFSHGLCPDCLRRHYPDFVHDRS